MKAYLERMKETFLSDGNMSFSIGSSILAAICCYLMTLANMGGQFGAGLSAVITILGTGLCIAAIPTVISTAFATLQFFAELATKDDPKQLLEDAKIRLEAEKILIEAERLAQERRELIDRHLQEQIHGADQIAKLLDGPKQNESNGRQRVAIC